MHLYKSVLGILVLACSLPIQASDWLPENLKSAACLSFAGIGVTYIWRQRTTNPPSILHQTANRLLEDRFALNRSESDWNLGGSLVYDMSTQEYDALLTDANLNQEMLESYEGKRVNMSLEENVKPERLRTLKDKIIITCTFENIDQKKLSGYNNDLQSTIKELQPQSLWQQLTRADQELLKKLKYRQEQIAALQEILDAKKAAVHKKILQDIFSVT